jgi:hypothetical protein
LALGEYDKFAQRRLTEVAASPDEFDEATKRRPPSRPAKAKDSAHERACVRE